MANTRSIPLDITDSEMAKIFTGIALYNNGTISVAYRRPIIISNILMNGDPLLHQPIGIAGSRIELMIELAPKAAEFIKSIRGRNKETK